MNSLHGGDLDEHQFSSPARGTLAVVSSVGSRGNELRPGRNERGELRRDQVPA
jgi:hypothetical protein